jgi:hypothetical protein
MTRHANKSIAVFAVTGVITLTIVGCSSAVPTGDPGVDRMGQYMLMNRGPEAEVLIGYRHAQNTLGSPWLMLEVAVTSPPGQTATIRRENVAVKTPAGATIPLASQREYNEAFGSLQAFIRAADVAREPMDYWPPRKRPCAIRLFSNPGGGVSFDEVAVNDVRACEGRFFFRIPGGVQAGRYVLTIDLEESEVRIPFTLED